MTPDAAFDSLADELLQQGARREQMMGRPMFSIDGKMFACLSNDRLGLRLGRGTADLDEALRVADATLFSPGGSDRVWRDWVSLPASAAAVWASFASRALEHRIA